MEHSLRFGSICQANECTGNYFEEERTCKVEEKLGQQRPFCWPLQKGHCSGIDQVLMFNFSLQKYVQNFKNKFPETTSLLLDHPIRIERGWPYHSTETFNNLERIFMDSLVTMVYKSDKLCFFPPFSLTILRDSSGRKKYIVDVDKEIHSSQSVDENEHDSTEESLKSKPFVVSTNNN